MNDYNIIDNEPMFDINDTTRAITCAAASEIAIIQFDHNSERFTFRLNKYIEGHDVTKCNKVEVHYKNIDAATREEIVGVYVIDDLQVDPENDTKVICTWLISQNSTAKVGKLTFLLRFSCVADDGTINYAWNTSIFTGITVSPGMYNSGEFVEEYIDIIEQLKVDAEKSLAEISSSVIPNIGNNGNWYIYDVDSGEYVDTGLCSQGPAGPVGETGPVGPQGKKGDEGYTPQRGVDYYNEEDKAEIKEYVETIVEQSPATTRGGGCPIDSAIVRDVFRCAMTYVNHINELTFTSSGKGTLFDDDFSADNPLIDCSSIMMAWMQGIPYEFSRYSGKDNIQHYRYGIKLPKNPYSEERPDRYYTHEIAHYLNDSGYCFKPNADYSNIAPGDIIFVSFKSHESEFHNNAYMKIDHCLLVVGYKDNLHLTCLHTSEQSTFKFYEVCVKNSAYDEEGANSYNDGIVLVARPPYKKVGNINTIPIINDETQRVTTDSAKHWFNTYELATPLKKNTTYTAVMNVENVVEETKPAQKNYVGLMTRYTGDTSDKTIVSWRGNQRPEDDVYYLHFVTDDREVSRIKTCVLNSTSAGHKCNYFRLYEGLIYPTKNKDDEDGFVDSVARNTLGDVETALDNIIAIQNELMEVSE